MNYSMFREFYCKVPFRSFSVKYVVEGVEEYLVNGKKYQVGAGQYLLANQYSEGFVRIESKNLVKGVCIDIAPDLLSEVVGSLRRPDTPFADQGLDVFFSSPDFLENQYQAGATQTGQLLHNLGIELSRDPFHIHRFSKEFYLNLTERIVADHIPLYRQLQCVGSIKPETKKDLVRKVHLGKSFMDAHFTLPLDIATVARESNLSEYHFFRLFKAVEGLSPYQYILRKRLLYAAAFIEKGQTSITDAAFAAGFTDIFSFSKAFKNHYGLSPSRYFRQPLSEDTNND